MNLLENTVDIGSVRLSTAGSLLLLVAIGGLDGLGTLLGNLLCHCSYNSQLDDEIVYERIASTPYGQLFHPGCPLHSLRQVHATICLRHAGFLPAEDIRLLGDTFRTRSVPEHMDRGPCIARNRHPGFV